MDWTDAGLGDQHGDVSRTLLLFQLGALAASKAGERIVLRATGPRMARVYEHAYAEALPLDDRRLRLWKPVHLLHPWTQSLQPADGNSGGKDPSSGLSTALEHAFRAALVET